MNLQFKDFSIINKIILKYFNIFTFALIIIISHGKAEIFTISSIQKTPN